METNDSENMTTQTLWDPAKAVLWGKFIAVQSYLKKQEKHRIDSLTVHLKQLEKEKQENPKISRRKEIIKIQAEINEKEMKETIVKINKTKTQIRRSKKIMKISAEINEKEMKEIIVNINKTKSWFFQKIKLTSF